MALGQAKKAWRLNKTTARRLEFRPIEREDMRYVWEAYRLGALPNCPEGLSTKDFTVAFYQWVAENWDAVWTLFAETGRGLEPVGLIFGYWPFRGSNQVMHIADLVWFPRATARNKVESAVNFFNEIRREINLFGYSRKSDKRLVEVVAKHGVLRRIGTSMNAFEDEPADVWETWGAKGDGHF